MVPPVIGGFRGVVPSGQHKEDGEEPTDGQRLSASSAYTRAA